MICAAVRNGGNDACQITGSDVNKYLYVIISCLLQTHKNLFYKHCEDCFKYDGLNVELTSTALSDVLKQLHLGPKCYIQGVTSVFLIFFHLKVFLKIRRPEILSKINMEMTVGYYDNNLDWMA